MRLVVLTAPAPGAVGIIQLHGRGVTALLERLTGRTTWAQGRCSLARLADIDEGMVVLWSETVAQVMPHGGPRVMARLVRHLVDLGARYDQAIPPRSLYPEARSDLEADLLATLARAASPAAIDLLLAQPALWRDWLAAARGGGQPGMSPRGPAAGDSPEARPAPADVILARAGVLNRLIDPPTVVVVGRPNVGKSTLTNALLGRQASIVADLPGTTRDWIAGLVVIDGIAVHWLDTPGLPPEMGTSTFSRPARPAGADGRRAPAGAGPDDLEERAVALARPVIAAADLLLVMRDIEQGWPDPAALPRRPDVWLCNKSDLRPAGGGDAIKAPIAGPGPGDAARVLHIAAVDDRTLTPLRAAVVAGLGLADLQPEVWAFSARLRALLEAGDLPGLAAYAAVAG